MLGWACGRVPCLSAGSGAHLRRNNNMGMQHEARRHLPGQLAALSFLLLASGCRNATGHEGGGDQFTGLGAPWNATTCNAAALPSRIPPADQRCPRCQGSLNIKSRTCTYCAFFPLTGCQGLGLASGPGIRKKRGEVSKETVPWEDE